MLARQRTGCGDPTFMQMKTGFWQTADPLGEQIICPRDGRPGCALVDWIARCERRQQSHFLSWTWRYSLSQVTSALKTFHRSSGAALHPQEVFFYMCFFVNNQYRIIVEESASGSENLEVGLTFSEALMGWRVWVQSPTHVDPGCSQAPGQSIWGVPCFTKGAPEIIILA